MNSAQWKELKTIFDQARWLDASSQSVLLDRECATDPELRQELESLLAASSNSDSGFLEKCALDEHHLALFRTLGEGSAGERIGPWRLIRVIGAGGMGTVYLAERQDGTYHAQAALKIVRRGMDSAIVLRRFRQERQILAQFNHPGIARLIDGGVCPDGRPYLAMEYIEGCAIDEYCDKNALSVKDRLELCLQVCNAVQSAHQLLIVHRDIKPGNILITPDGVARLLDFGVAKLLDQNPSSLDLELTVAGGQLLTPQFASPEQVRGELVTVATDVYALGLLLYRLLTGDHPYTANSLEELKLAVCRHEPAPPSVTLRHQHPEKKLSWSRDLDLIVLQALRKEPSRRYQSVEQLAEDLRRYLRRMPVSARPHSTSYRAGKFVARHRLAVAAGVSGLLLLSLGIAATLWQAGIARQERARAERHSAETRRIANSLLFELYDVLKEIPGTTGARELVARRGTELYRELSQEAGTDVGLRRELAAGYEKLADIKGGTARANTGNKAGAQADYRKAAALYKALIDQGPVQADDLHGLSAAYSALAAATLSVSLQASDEWVSKAELTDLDGMRKWPADPKFRRGLAYDLQQLGSNQAMRGNLQQDLTDHQQALQILQVLVAINNAQDEDWYRVSFAHKRLAAILITLNRLNEALDHDEQALKIDTDLLRKKPNDPSKRLAITYAYNDIGYIYSARGQFKRALAFYRHGLWIREALAAADPKDARVRESLGNSWCYLGGILQQQGNSEQALSSYSKCLAVRKSDALAHAANLPDLPLAEVFSEMGTAHAGKASKESASAARDDWEKARSEFRSALEIYRTAGVSDKKFALSDRKRAEAASGLAQAETKLHLLGR